MMRALEIFVLVTCLYGNGAEAQERVQEGERVRVEHRLGGGEPEMLEGWLVRIHPGDSIVMATRVSRDRVSFRTPEVDRFQAYRVDTRSGRFGVIGTLAGAVAVYPFTEAECSPTRTEVCLGRVTTLYVAAGGLLVGALIGSFFKVPTWKDIAPDSFRVPLLSPALTFDGGFGFTARVALKF
jgi:hypothetical protein